jgi:hypothetical protein
MKSSRGSGHPYQGGRNKPGSRSRLVLGAAVGLLLGVLVVSPPVAGAAGQGG